MHCALLARRVRTSFVREKNRWSWGLHPRLKHPDDIS